MKVLYIGDIMAEPGIVVVERILPKLRHAEALDLVVAQAENVTDGRGLSPEDWQRLKAVGVDACTAGNWTMYRKELHPFLDDPAQPLTRPANYPAGTSGLPFKYVETPKGRVLLISLLGGIVGRDSDKPTDNPLQVVDAILGQEKDTDRLATIVNFHGDFSSEKRIIGYYLDGRASMVVGDHWHVPTADAAILPKGTAHMSDVGMCGSLDSSLGVSFDSVIPRWRDGIQTRNIIETNGRMQFNALLVEIDETTHLAQTVQAVQRLLPGE